MANEREKIKGWTKHHVKKKKGLGNNNISCFEDQDPSSPSCVFHIFVVMECVHLSGRLYCNNSWRY